MKKFLPLLLLLVGSLFIFSCKDDDDDYVQVDVDYPAVYDLRNVNFTNNADFGWHYGQGFKQPLLDQDYVIIFRQTGTNNGAPVWQQIPRTLYPFQNDLEFDYDFDFSKTDFMIYAGGNYDISTTPQYLNNQTFRVVLVPAVYGKNANSADLKKMSYEEVIAKYKIDDSKVGTL